MMNIQSMKQKYFKISYNKQLIKLNFSQLKINISKNIKIKHKSKSIIKIKLKKMNNRK